MFARRTRVMLKGAYSATFNAAGDLLLALAWAVAEVAGSDRSLNEKPRQAPLFYGLCAAAIALGATLVLTSHSLVRLDVQPLAALTLEPTAPRS